MTPDEVLAEYHHVIAEYDRLHAPCPIEQRKQRRQAEKQQLQNSEVKKVEHQALTDAQWDEWFLQKLNDALLDKERCAFIKAVGQCLGETRAQLRQDYTAKIAVLETRLKDLEHQQSLETKFFEIEHRLDARQLARDQAKRESEIIPQSELLAKIEKLQCQVGNLGSVADLDARCRELTERVGELERTNSLEARFTKLADEVKRGSEMIPQSQLLPEIEKLQRQRDDLQRVADLDAGFRELAERLGELEKTNSLEARFAKLANEAERRSEILLGELLEKIEGLQCQLDDLKRVADLDARFGELAERVGELEKTTSLEARFAKLAHEAERRSEIPQGELLEKIEGLQRQINDLRRVADLDAPFGELTERVGELEKTVSLEARFTRLADEVKGGSDLPQSELMARIVELERRFNDFKKIANQPGPQGPPGKDGKLPIAKVFQKDTVCYSGDVVTCDGSTYQALRDTGQNVNHADWVCLARAGRNGSDGRAPNVCGTYDAREKYERLDIVALDGAAFIARRDNPGICPGDGWQLLCRQGRPGHRGESITGPRGEKGEKGEPGATVVSWQLDRVSPLMSDGKVGPMLELRGLFEGYHEVANS